MNEDILNAVHVGNIQRILYLLNSGVDVNVQDNSGWTPLHYAAYFDRPEIAELLIMRGANVDLKNSDGKTPLILSNFLKVSELLLKHEADINAQSRSGSTALHRAAALELYAVAKLLLDWNADFEIEDDNSKTPEQMESNVRIKNLFLEKKARDAREKGIDAEKLKPKM